MKSLNEQIAALALEYVALKVPFQHRGMTRNGCDCTGLIVAICRELGFLSTFVLRQYKTDWNLHAGAGNRILEELDKVGNVIPNSEAGIGDIAVMWMGRYPGHCGIIVNPGPVMVHLLKTERFCKKSVLKNSNWSKCWRATYRLDEEKLKR